MRHVAILALSAGVQVLSASICAAAATNVVGFPASMAPAIAIPQLAARLNRPLNPKHDLLYEGSLADSVVNVYDLSRAGYPIVQSITNGVSKVCGLALDTSASLYVCNLGSGNVTVYPFGATSPTLTLSDPVRVPAAVGVAPDGTVFVSGGWMGAPAVDEYAPGATSPTMIITNSLIRQPTNMAFDAAGDAYIDDGISGVYEIPFGSDVPTSLGLQGLGDLSGIALDSATSRLYTTNFGTKAPYMNVYTLGNSVPLYHYPIDAAQQIVIGSGKFSDLFLPDADSSNTTLVHLNARHPFATLAMTYDAVGIAFKAGSR